MYEPLACQERKWDRLRLSMSEQSVDAIKIAGATIYQLNTRFQQYDVALVLRILSQGTREEMLDAPNAFRCRH